MKKQKLYLYNYTQCNGIETIKLYVSNRYPRYLDYAKYHAEHAKIPGEAGDVLNEVLLSLFSKDFEFLAKLYSTQRNGYTDLDFFILQMLKLNCHSLTSPYRHKNRLIPADRNINYQKLNIADEQDEQIDNAEITLKQFRLVRFIFERLELTELERKVFEHAFILHLTQPEFTETAKNMYYRTYKLVKESIHEILYVHKLTSIKPSHNNEVSKRKNELVSGFLKSRKMIIKHSNN
ncbi:MAG TPA: hypothetical protein P5210_14115 [Draconibacterium sp.]|nr:hypothetical protein [Draconibacterium sp.]